MNLPSGPLTTSELAAAGVTRAARRVHYFRIWRGMYGRNDQVDGLDLRSRALARLFPEGVLRGRSAAQVWGDDSIPTDCVPEIWLPSTRKAPADRIYRYGELPAYSVTEVDGLSVTTPLRTCRDLSADLGFEDAVVSVERLCAMVAELPAQLRAVMLHPSNASQPGGRRARDFDRVVRALDTKSLSALSTRVRLELAAAGFDRFVHAHRVRVGPRTIEFALADPAARCGIVTTEVPLSAAGRADGGPAADPRSSTDLLTRIRQAGWTVVIVRDRAREGVPHAARLRQIPGADPGSDPIEKIAVLLAARWPGTEVYPAVVYDSASDPHGIWGSRR
ncbi:MAG: hypothetical protein GX636_07445 [Actinomycetales bacterium]|nr:hypothetical protein [Actinomycetales bacterium]